MLNLIFLLQHYSKLSHRDRSFVKFKLLSVVAHFKLRCLVWWEELCSPYDDDWNDWNYESKERLLAKMTVSNKWKFEYIVFTIRRNACLSAYVLSCYKAYLYIYAHTYMFVKLSFTMPGRLTDINRIDFILFKVLLY